MKHETRTGRIERQVGCQLRATGRSLLLTAMFSTAQGCLVWAAATLIACSTAQTAEKAKTYRSITWEQLLKAGPPLEQVGWLATRHSREITGSDWSIGCETLDRDQAKFSVYKDYVGQLGAKHGRLQSGWAKCEKQKGVYQFEWLDECVDGLIQQGVEPWMCLCYGNPIYGSNIQLGSALAPIVQSEEAMAAWLKYVEATVARYRGRVKTWEIWNEPFGQGKDYAVLLLATAERIKKIQPDAVVMVTAVLSTDRAILLEALKSAGKLDLVDCWSYHPYDRNPDSSYAAVEKMKAELARYSPKYKVYQGEAGCPAILEWTHALNHYPWTEYSQAKWNLRRMAGDRIREIPCSVFTIIDLKYPDMLQSFGLIRSNLRNEFIYKRPTYYAVQHMMSFFDDSVKPVGFAALESNSTRPLTVARFEKANRPIVLLWYGDRIPDDRIEWDLVDIVLKDVVFQNPVYTDMLTGKVFALKDGTWRRDGANAIINQLPVWDSPMMLAEREHVVLRAVEASPSR